MFNDLEEFIDNIRIFTNVDFIKEKYNNDYFEFVEDFDESDIAIVDNNYVFKGYSNLKINIEKLDLNVDAFINKNYIIPYLNLLKKFDLNTYNIQMADITDVIKVTRGSLDYYIKLELNKDYNTDDLLIKLKDLEYKNINGSAIVFLYSDNYLILDKLVKKFANLYENFDIVVLKSSKIDIKDNEYIEVFIFKGEEISE